MKVNAILNGVGDLIGVGSLNYIAYTISSAFNLGEARIVALCAIVYSIVRIIYLINKYNDNEKP